MNRKTIHACLVVLAATAFGGLTATGQSTPAPVKGMASTVGLYVYPEKQQAATQQLTDESQCYSSAKSQTGFDPNATTTGTKSGTKKTSGDHGAAKGAMRGAVISGAVGGDATQGAARGAVLGGAMARRRKKQATEQADKTADATKTAEQQKMDNFKRAMSACLEARSYSVK